MMRHMKAGPARGWRALVVEDDPDIAMLIEFALGDLGFEVTIAADGTQAVEKALAEKFDVITLDLGLPELDGIEVCRRVRTTTDAYIIMVTARGQMNDRLTGLETGADDFMIKPIDPRELQARVNAMMRRPRTDGEPASEVLVHQDLFLDLDARRAFRGEEELPITKIEFDLLAVLMRDPNRAISREELMQAVWGTDWTGDTHLVEVHVGNLRRKIGGARYIQTVRGIGYRMAIPSPA